MIDKCGAENENRMEQFDTLSCSIDHGDPGSSHADFLENFLK